MIKKAIVLNGLARGGTNILWNLIQSHPKVVAPDLETNQMTGGYGRLRYIDRLYRWMVDQPVISSVGLDFFEQKFCRSAGNPNGVNNIIGEHPGLPYTKETYKTAAICFKGVCSPKFWSLDDNQLLNRISSDITYISLVRDGLSVCEGWTRRGTPAHEAAKLYNSFCKEIMELDKKMDKHLIVKFEDVLLDPFGVAEKVHRFCDLPVVELENIRLKVKRTLAKDGTHSTRFGRENEHYWFDRTTVTDIIKPNINATQNSALSAELRTIVIDEAGEALQTFGYL